jgi:DNA-binding MarR family transcriptional regulator
MRSDNIEETIDLLFRLPRIMRQSMERNIFAPPLKSFGKHLAPHHMAIMKLLDDEGTLCITEIGHMIKVAKAQMTHSIDKLTALDMIERVPYTGDRRKTGIRLTAEGKKLIAKIDRAVEKRMKEMLSLLDDEALAKFLEALKYLTATFDKLK